MIDGYALKQQVEDIESGQSAQPETTARIDVAYHPGALGVTVSQTQFNITEAIIAGKTSTHGGGYVHY